jgi:hypothetical protein
LELGSAAYAGRVSGRRITQAGPEFGWTGTIRVVRQGSDTFKEQPNSPVSVAVKARAEITYTLRGDGSAGYTATYDETQTYATPDGTYTSTLNGSGGGDVMAGVEPMESNPLAALLGASGNWHIAADAAKLRVTTIPPAEGQDVFGGGLAPLGITMIMPTRTTSTESFGQIEVFSPEPRTATHLSGSKPAGRGVFDVGPHALGWVGLPLTETVTWDLTKGAVTPTPKVTIYGPHCTCLESGADASTLKFFATTAVPGGEFSEFEVAADGEKPDIDTNEGGDGSVLELTPTEKTGGLTLNAHYTKDGKRYDAAPFKVDFCQIDPIELNDDEHDLSFDDASQVLTVGAKTKALFDGREANGDIAWDLEKMGAPAKLTMSPDPARGQAVTFKYTGLPSKNSDFGPKKISAEVTRGGCTCQQHERVRTFFVIDGGNNPSPTAVPNWFYYWPQTSAADATARPLLRYKARIPAVNNPNDSVAARWEYATEHLLLSDWIIKADGCQGQVERTGPYPRPRTSREIAIGIDCLAEDIRHEMQHRVEAIKWWGSPRGTEAWTLVAWLALDKDGDGVPDDVERNLPGCRTIGPGAKYSCADRPFENVTDAEITAYWVGWSWPLGSVNRSDWSCGPGSKQWHGSRCQ